jgi:hypothetical protein
VSQVILYTKANAIGQSNSARRRPGKFPVTRPVRRLTGDIRPAHLSSRHHSRPRGKPDGRKSKAPTDDEIAQTAESALPPKKPPAPSVKRRSRRSIKRGLA